MEGEALPSLWHQRACMTMVGSVWVFQGLFHSARSFWVSTSTPRVSTTSTQPRVRRRLLSSMSPTLWPCSAASGAQPLEIALSLVGRQPLSLPHWALCS